MAGVGCGGDAEGADRRARAGAHGGVLGLAEEEEVLLGELPADGGAGRAAPEASSQAAQKPSAPSFRTTNFMRPFAGDSKSP